MSLPSSPSAVSPPGAHPHAVAALRRFGLEAMAATLLVAAASGSAVIIPYQELTLVPLFEPLQQATHRSFLLRVLPLVYVLGTAVGLAYLASVWRGGQPQRALAVPWGIGVLMLGCWAAAVVGSGLWMARYSPLGDPGLWLHYLAAPALCGAYNVALIVFFLERMVQRRIVAVFYADGDLPPGATRFTVRQRQWVLYLASGLIPLVVLVGVAAVHLRAAERAVPASLFYTAAMLAVIGMLLATLVARSIHEPIAQLKAAADAVRRGDLTARVPVRTTDELGSLAVAFNDMVAGLAERTRIQELFGRLVSHEVSQGLIDGRIRLEGEVREVAVLFCDLRGFTARSETLPAQELIEFLNHYYEVVVAAIEANHGRVDKFIGDAIMAVFGAPIADAAAARHAFSGALAVLDGIERLRRDTTRGEFADLRVSIGMHWGPVVAGGLGSANRQEYTIVGDTVNVAARLEAEAKAHDVPLVCTDAVFTQLEPAAQAKLTLLGDVALRGRAASVRLYRLAARNSSTGTSAAT